MSLSEAPVIETPTPVSEQVDSPEQEKIPESVIKLLLARKETGYRRGIDDDGRKIGLAFDAGAYAGVVSLAMARELQEAGLLDYVDAFYGNSAGGINAAYAATGQIEEGIDTYVNLMPDNKLVELPTARNPRMPKMDLNVLRDALYRGHPLKIKELMDSKVPVVVGVTNLSSPYMPAKMFKSTEVDPKHPEEFIEQMVMGCNLPGIAGGPIKDKSGHEYTDATLAWSSPVELAIADGCTDVLSLANSAISTDEPSLGAKTAVRAAGAAGSQYMAAKAPKVFKDEIREQKLLWKLTHPLQYVAESVMSEGPSVFPNYSDTLRKAVDTERNYRKGLFNENGVTVERIYPPDVPGLPELLTTDKARLNVGIKSGQLALSKALKAAALR